MALLKKNAKPENARPASKRAAARAGFRALFRKEMSDHLNGVRFYILFAVLILISALSISGAVATMKESTEPGNGFTFLKFLTTDGGTLYSMMTFMALLGPVVGIAMGFDSISNERSLGTLNRLAAQPIYRDAVINAKFFAGAVMIAVMVVALELFTIAMAIFTTGIVPSGEEMARLVVFFLFIGAYLCLYLALSMLFSVVCKNTATAALIVIAIWLVTSLFMGQIANGITYALYPIDETSSVADTVRNINMNYAINRISPYYLFTEAATILLSPYTRSLGAVTNDQMVGAITAPLPFGQSMLLIWPHLVAMIAIAAIAFAVAYIKFMKQEIRG